MICESVDCCVAEEFLRRFDGRRVGRTTPRPEANDPLADGTGATCTPVTSMSGTIDGGGYTYFTGTSAEVNVGGAFSAASLAEFIGTGSTTLDAGFDGGTSSETTTAPGGTVFVGTGGIGSGNVTLIFTYTPVPLPAAFPLLVSVLAGLGAMSRRRSAVLARAKPSLATWCLGVSAEVFGC